MNKSIRQNERTLEYVVFGLFLIWLIIVSYFHEPWFDEAQAWQIARCASIKDIIFLIPHYEGHPALWHLILSIPAKLGIPYELGLKTIACIPTILSGFFILFYSPFPKIVRILLPFHYFIFYQFGVLARPYGYMTLALVLLAMAYKQKDIKPWKFIILLAFLCSLCGYGIVLAGGIAAAWGIGIITDYHWRLKKDFWLDKRVVALFVLLLYAILIILQIMPYEDTYATSIEWKNPKWLTLLYTFFAMLPDSTIVNVLHCEAFLPDAYLNDYMLIIAVIIGILFLVCILLVSNRENRLMFILPYFLLAYFTGAVYLSAHHIGIILIFVIFWLWIALNDHRKEELWRIIEKKHPSLLLELKKYKPVGIVGGLCVILVPSLWMLVATCNEVKTDYYYSKKAAEFLLEYHLDQANFLGEWFMPYIKEDETGLIKEAIDVGFLTYAGHPVAILPYINRNFCINLNFGDDNLGYQIHKKMNQEESEKVIEEIRKQGAPDGFIGNVDLSLIYGDSVNIKDYVPIYKIEPDYVSIWKLMRYDHMFIKPSYIYLKKDLLEEYGNPPIIQLLIDM